MGLLGKLARALRREPKYLTVEEAIARGVVSLEDHHRALVLPSLSVRFYDHHRDEWGHPRPVPREQVYYPGGWKQFRHDLTSRYLGSPGVGHRDVRSGVREQVADLTGTTEQEIAAARGFQLDRGLIGLAKVTED